jgi:cell division protein FtsB
MTQNVKLQLAAVTARAQVFLAAAGLIEEYDYVVASLVQENKELEAKVKTLENGGLPFEACRPAEPIKSSVPGQNAGTQSSPQ